MNLETRIEQNLLFWILLAVILAFVFGFVACLRWQKSKLSIHEVRNKAGRPVYWVLNYGRVVIDVGTRERVRRRRRRFEATIEGRDAYVPARMAPQRGADSDEPAS